MFPGTIAVASTLLDGVGQHRWYPLHRQPGGCINVKVTHTIVEIGMVGRSPFVSVGQDELGPLLPLLSAGGVIVGLRVSLTWEVKKYEAYLVEDGRVLDRVTAYSARHEAQYGSSSLPVGAKIAIHIDDGGITHCTTQIFDRPSHVRARLNQLVTPEQMNDGSSQVVFRRGSTVGETAAWEEDTKRDSLAANIR